MGSIAKRLAPVANTSNLNNYVSGPFTPTVGDLLYGFSHASGSIDAAPALVASANGLTFTRVARLEHTLSGNVSGIYVADQLVPASPASMTVTAQHPTDPATGCFIAVGAVIGMTKVGAAAVKQLALAPNLGANAPFTATFAAAVDAANPVSGFVGWLGTMTITAPPAPAGQTAWTELDQPTPQATPVAAFEWAKVDSGDTATAYTWSVSAASTRANVAAIEFDISAGGAAPGFEGWGIPL